MNYVEDSDSDLKKTRLDDVVEKDGVKVYVDPKALFNIVGTTMDWEETELTAEFTFKNPNAKGECGCGESFNVD
jgi:iron-sulfur cluster assembly protein